MANLLGTERNVQDTYPKRARRHPKVRARHVPVPFGAGLHVGHPKDTASDVMSRYWRMMG
jgi:leucyl-tRNA synthetase